MSCGNGVKSRSVDCSGNRGKCDVQTKPTSTDTCNLGSCPVWKVANWGRVRITLYVHFMQKKPFEWTYLLIYEMLLPGSERIFSGSRIRTPLGKWDSPKSPQGYCCPVADLDFQIKGRLLKWHFLLPFGPHFGLNIRGGPPLDPPLIRKENGFQEKDDRSSGYRFVVKRSWNVGWGHVPTSLQTLSYLPCFISSTFRKRKQYLIHPHQRQQKQQILLRFNI